MSQSELWVSSWSARGLAPLSWVTLKLCGYGTLQLGPRHHEMKPRLPRRASSGCAGAHLHTAVTGTANTPY